LERCNCTINLSALFLRWIGCSCKSYSNINRTDLNTLIGVNCINFALCLLADIRIGSSTKELIVEVCDATIFNRVIKPGS
jgi:hypothetical protein